MANETPPIVAIQNADGSYDIQLHWQWVDGIEDAHGWLLHILRTDSTTYADPTDISTSAETTVIKLSSSALSHSLSGVNPTDRYSFAIQSFFNASQGLAKGDIVSFQTEDIWDGQGGTPDPNQDDWIDWQAGDYVDLSAPRTSLILHEETSAYYILDLTVDDRNDEGTTTYIRSAAREGDNWGTFVAIVPASGMAIIDPFNGGVTYDTKPGGTNLPVKILKNQRDVIFQYYSEGDQSGRTEETREWIGDMDSIPRVTSTDVALPSDGDPTKRVLHWICDDDTDFVKLYTVVRSPPSRTLIYEDAPTDTDDEFAANGSYEITDMEAGDEVTISIEPWGRNRTQSEAQEVAVDVTLQRGAVVDPIYGLILDFVDITNDQRYDVELTFELRERNSNTILDFTTDGGQIGFTTDPGSGFDFSNVDSGGQVTFGPFPRPPRNRGNVYYFQGYDGTRISEIRQFTIDGDQAPELHQVSYQFDGIQSLILKATGDDDVAGIGIERASDKGFTTDVQTIVYIENTTGTFEYVHVPLPGEHWYVRVRGFDEWSGSAPTAGAITRADGTPPEARAPYYYANARRTKADAVEIFNLHEETRTDTDSTWEFDVIQATEVAQVNVMYRDDTFPDPATFNPANPEDTIIVVGTGEPGHPTYDIVIPLPDPDVVRYVLFEVLDGNGHVTETELVTLYVRQGSPPQIRQKIITNDDVDKSVDIYANIRSASGAYPIASTLYRYNDDTTNWVSVDTDSFASDTEKLLLNDEVLLFQGRTKFYIKAIDDEGLESEVYFDVDRDHVPSGYVDKSDRSPTPAININYDDEVTWVRVTLPDNKTWTVDDLDGGWGGQGGEVRYTVGVDTTDQATVESQLVAGEIRGPYLIQVGDRATGEVIDATPNLVYVSGPDLGTGTFDLDVDVSGAVDIIFSPPDGALSAKYVTDIADTPTEGELEAGTLHVFSTDGYLANDVFTFTSEDQVFVGVIYYFNEAGTGVHTTPQFSSARPYATGATVVVQVDKYDPADASLDGFHVDVYATGDNVALYHRVIDEGDTDPVAYTRHPVSGFVSDPLLNYAVLATKPTTVDAPRKMLQVYGIDDESNRSSTVIVPVDYGSIPDLVHHSVTKDAIGNLYMDWTMDSDGVGVRVLVSQASEQSPPTAITGTYHPGTSDVNVIVATSLDPALPVYWALSPVDGSGSGAVVGQGIAGYMPAFNPQPGLQIDVTPGATSYDIAVDIVTHTGSTLTDYEIFRDPGTGSFASWKTEANEGPGDPPYEDSTITRHATDELVYRYYIVDNDTAYASEYYTVTIPPQNSSAPILEVDVNPLTSDNYEFSVTPLDYDATALTNYTLGYAIDTFEGQGSFTTPWKTEADTPPHVLQVARGTASSGEDKVVRFKLTNDDTGIQTEQAYTVPALPSVESVTVTIDVAVSEPTHTLTVDVFPASAALTVKLNGSDDTVSITDNGAGNYTYVMTRTETGDQIAVFEATLSEVRAGSAGYTLDRDNRPGISSVFVDNYIRRPRIIATRDDDAYQTQIKVNAAVVSGPGTAATISWTASSNYADDASNTFSVEVRKQGGSWLEVASGDVFGPIPTDFPTIDIDVTPGPTSYAVSISVASGVGGSPPSNYTIRRNTGSIWTDWEDETDPAPHEDTITRSQVTDKVYRYMIRDRDTNYIGGVHQVFVPAISSVGPILEIDVDVRTATYEFSIHPYKSDGVTQLTDYELTRVVGSGSLVPYKTEADHGGGEPPYADSVDRAEPGGLDTTLHYRLLDNDTGFSTDYSYAIPAQSQASGIVVITATWGILGTLDPFGFTIYGYSFNLELGAGTLSVRVQYDIEGGGSEDYYFNQGPGSVRHVLDANQDEVVDFFLGTNRLTITLTAYDAVAAGGDAINSVEWETGTALEQGSGTVVIDQGDTEYAVGGVSALSGGGADFDDGGQLIVKPADFVQIGGSDPSGTWGPGDRGKSWIDTA